MLGSPRKHKTLTHALQYLHITLSGGALSCNQNSNYLLNSIQIWESTEPDRRPFRLAIWLSDMHSFMLICLFLHNLDETQLHVTTKLPRQHSFSGGAVWWNMVFPYNPPIICVSFLELEISLGAMLVRNKVRLRLLLPQHNKNLCLKFFWQPVWEWMQPHLFRILKQITTQPQTVSSFQVETTFWK